MNRSDLVTEMAARFDQFSQSDAEMAVTTILEAMGEAIVHGHRIEIRGFGAFSVNLQAPRTGRNPRNGDSVAVPARRVVHFKPGKALREDVDVVRAAHTDTMLGCDVAMARGLADQDR
jgi:integration host factor subunit beta